MNSETDARSLARKLGMPYVDIEKAEPDRRCVRLLKEVFARNYTSIPVRFLNGGVLVAMGSPEDREHVEAMSFHMGKKVYPALADRQSVLNAINTYYAAAPGAPRVEPKAAAPVVQPRGDEIRRENHTIAVISNKGGVGKTHTSTNVAKLLSDKGKRVLLIDTDLGNADISNKLAVFPEYTLLDFMEGDVALNDVIIDTPLGFDLIGGSSGEFKLANINYVQRSKFIRNFNKVSANYDYTIFDLSAGIGSTVLDFALASDEIVVVTTPQDIIAGYACIKAAFQRFKAIEEKLMAKVEDYQPRRDFTPWVVMNQVSSLKQGIFLYNRICQTADERINNQESVFAVRPEYLGGVIFDKDTYRKTEMQRKPLTTLFPNSKPAQCLEHLSNNLMSPPDMRSSQQQLKGGLGRFAAVLGMS